MKDYVNPQLLVTAEDLAERLSATGNNSDLVTLIDLRTAEEFSSGHLDGAVHLDLFGLSIIDTDPAPLKAFLWIIANLLVSRGVTPEKNVVVYDSQSGIRAARAFWFLEVFGHRNVQVLDGGFKIWESFGFPATKKSIVPAKGDWSVCKNNSVLATWKDVYKGLDNEKVVILDTRSENEYLGMAKRAKRSGAIPGAINIEWTENLKEDGTFKPASELSVMYQEAGVTPDKEVISYCQGGYRAAHSYLALRLLGYSQVRNYVGSWKEWGDRVDLPVEIPESI
tara:strand:+ start:66057 stop:66899 length:843 start_codon:yes stop_codon:yes gene_type:complete